MRKTRSGRRVGRLAVERGCWVVERGDCAGPRLTMCVAWCGGEIDRVERSTECWTDGRGGGNVLHRRGRPWPWERSVVPLSALVGGASR